MLGLTRLLAVLMIVALLVSACRPVQVPVSRPAPKATDLPTAIPTAAGKPSHIAYAQMERKTAEITSQALAGNLLGDPATRTVNVLLPPSYASSETRYPVLYVLPWGDGDPAGSTLVFRSAMESLLNQGEINEMIIVVPDGTNKLGASQFRSSPTIGNYETYLARDVVEYVDKNYRTLATRDSRGLAGCSNGGDASMRLALKYPDIFSVASPTGGIYDETLERNAALLKELGHLKSLPQEPVEVASFTNYQPMAGGYIQAAAGNTSNPNNPPLYFDMPFRIVNDKAEIVPEVSAKIVANDSIREAQRYVEQPLRLRGILIQHGLQDITNPTELVRGFDRLLTELGVDHKYVETDTGHCANAWEVESLKFMADHLVFQTP